MNVSRVIVSCSVGGLSVTQGDEYGEGFEEEPRGEAAGGVEHVARRVVGGGGGPAWGHRKIWAMGHWDGWDLGSPSSVHRAIARRGLLQPVRYQAERRQLAAARREAFLEPPARRNRVWQVDFSAYQTTTEGAWALCGVVDYAAKLALACPVTVTQTAADLLAAIDAAEQAAGALLGRPRIEDCAAPATGEIVPLVIVSDNGPAMKSTAVARWFATRAHLAHVRTRHPAPWTNGVVERWIESLKYEHLYRHHIASGPELADHVAAFTDTYNTIRPWRRTGCASSPGWATTSASDTAWNWLAARRSGRRGVSWPSMPPPRGGKAGKLRLGKPDRKDPCPAPDRRPRRDGIRDRPRRDGHAGHRLLACGPPGRRLVPQRRDRGTARARDRGLATRFSLRPGSFPAARAGPDQAA